MAILSFHPEMKKKNILMFTSENSLKRDIIGFWLSGVECFRSKTYLQNSHSNE